MLLYPFFLGEDDAPNSKTLVASSVNIGVGAPVNNQKATQLTIIGNVNQAQLP